MTPRKTTKAKSSPRPAKSASAGASSSKSDDGGLAVALKALDLALDKKALEPVLLDVRELCGYCNFQLIVSGRSDRQVDAISEGVVIGLRDLGLRPLGTEGKRSGHWSLLDFGDVIVHVFHHPLREHYDLEGLWNDAPRVEIEVPPEAKVSTETY
jgi:ribosome-associated protein